MVTSVPAKRDIGAALRYRSGCAKHRTRAPVRRPWIIPVALFAGWGALFGVPVFTTFTDITATAKIAFRNQASHTPEKYLLETMGAGVAVLDYDGDGLLDIFFVNGAALPGMDKSEPRYWNRLYRNRGDGTFADVTEAAGIKGSGYGMGVAVADYDNDGRPDLFITNFGHNLLYHNEGNGRFRNVTSEAGVAGGGWSTGAAFLDYDRDGQLDLFVARYLDWDFSNNPWCGPQRVKQRGYCHPNAFNAVTHLLYHNEGHGRFREVSRQTGIAAHPGKGLGVAINDYDGDGWPDILVANDSVAQQLFHNNGNGTFSEVALEAGVAFNQNGRSFAGMGVDFSDFNNDGKPDIFLNALSLEGYALFRNTGKLFDDDSDAMGISRITRLSSGWGTKFVDFDNDGRKDLFVAQGHVMDTISIDEPSIPYLQKPLLLRNTGRQFVDVSSGSGPAFDKPLASRGAAFGDLNNDGCIDIVVNNNDDAPLVFRNDCATLKRNWILIRTVGTNGNRDGIGARVRLVSESGRAQYMYVSTASSYLSASDPRVHFGLGNDTRIREIEVQWPSGKTQRISNPKANQILTIREP